MPAVPAAGVPDKMPVPGVKVTPAGRRMPVMERVGVGEPVAVTTKLPPTPSVKLAVLGLVIAEASLTVILKFCVASGNVPLEAVTMPVYVPIDVGVPDNRPAAERVRPFGSEPDVTEKVIGAVPVAV